jgi:hypothetical protein
MAQNSEGRRDILMKLKSAKGLLIVGATLILIASPLTAMAQQRHFHNENGQNSKTNRSTTST